MVSATDGSAFTGSVTVAVTGNGGTQATGTVGSGACTHEGNGFHTYAPAQAETNYDHVAFTFTGTGAIPVTVQIYTTFPQTGDNYARLGAPAGASIAADIAAIEAQTDDIGAAGAGLTAIPWNAAWDAQVESEVADALAVYDPPTNAELVSEINSGPYGLQAGVYTDRLGVAERLFRELEVGGVIVNDVPTTRYDHQPYGGTKDSGQGREGVRYAMDEMTESKFLALSSHIPE